MAINLSFLSNTPKEEDRNKQQIDFTSDRVLLRISVLHPDSLCEPVVSNHLYLSQRDKSEVSGVWVSFSGKTSFYKTPVGCVECLRNLKKKNKSASQFFLCWSQRRTSTAWEHHPT